MPITGRNRNEVARRFADHLNTVLNTTITQSRLIPLSSPPSAIAISFRDRHEASVIPLRTRYGVMDLYIGQRCDAVPSDVPGTYELRTLAYRYAVTPRAMNEPLFRWEYVRTPEPDANNRMPEWCRHHIQGDIAVRFTDDRGRERQARLNDWHTPTGWVAIEEVIRFCIVDLGIPKRDGWERVLQDSYRKFRTEFATRGEE